MNIFLYLKALNIEVESLKMKNICYAQLNGEKSPNQFIKTDLKKIEK